MLATLSLVVRYMPLQEGGRPYIRKKPRNQEGSYGATGFNQASSQRSPVYIILERS